MLQDKIRAKRTALGLSLYEVSRRTGQSVSTLHGIENGDNSNPSFRTVCLLSKVLGIPLDELAQEMNLTNERKS